MKNNKIMIVEDEAGIREMTEKYLQQEGYQVVATKNGHEALEMLHIEQPDLILLDVEMPGIDGFTVCQEIRKQMTIPIIFVTVRRSTFDKVKSFELGADDHLTKPFDFEELGARIKANLRRYYTYPRPVSNILKYGPLEIHLHNFKCYLDGKTVDLSAKEMELLIHLARHPNQVWSQEQLYDHVWQLDATGNSETVKVHISHLRRKLEKDPAKPKFIKTVHGFGYSFADQR